MSKSRYNPEGLHNFFYNGWFDLWQRTVGVTQTLNSATAAKIYSADRSFFATTGTTVKNASVLRSTDVPVVGGISPSYSYEFRPVTAISSLAATDYIQPFRQVFEGYDYIKMHGKTMTFGFFVKTNKAGLLGVRFLKYLPAGLYEAYVTSVSISLQEVDTWVYKEVTMSWSSQIPMSLTNGTAASVEIGSVTGSNAVASDLNQWVSGTMAYHGSLINIMDSTSNYLKISAVSFVIGDGYGNSFYQRNGIDFHGDLRNCQRYFEKSYPFDVAVGTATGSHAIQLTSAAVHNYPGRSTEFKTVKRTDPSVNVYSTNTGASGLISRDGSDATASFQWIGPGGFSVVVSNVSTVANAFVKWHYSADADF